VRSIGSDFETQLRTVFTGWVCYPFAEYLDPTNFNSKSILSHYVPALAADDPTEKKAAYYQLGTKTGMALDALVASPATKPDVGVVKWDGANWGPA
jgi:hypothetical protein